MLPHPFRYLLGCGTKGFDPDCAIENFRLLSSRSEPAILIWLPAPRRTARRMSDSFQGYLFPFHGFVERHRPAAPRAEVCMLECRFSKAPAAVGAVAEERSPVVILSLRLWPAVTRGPRIGASLLSHGYFVVLKISSASAPRACGADSGAPGRGLRRACAARSAAAMRPVC